MQSYGGIIHLALHCSDKAAVYLRSWSRLGCNNFARTVGSYLMQKTDDTQSMRMTRFLAYARPSRCLFCKIWGPQGNRPQNYRIGDGEEARLLPSPPSNPGRARTHKSRLESIFPSNNDLYMSKPSVRLAMNKRKHNSSRLGKKLCWNSSFITRQ
jgi:hypothetical protein